MGAVARARLPCLGGIMRGLGSTYDPLTSPPPPWRARGAWESAALLPLREARTPPAAAASDDADALEARRSAPALAPRGRACAFLARRADAVTAAATAANPSRADAAASVSCCAERGPATTAIGAAGPPHEGPTVAPPAGPRAGVARETRDAFGPPAEVVPEVFGLAGPAAAAAAGSAARRGERGPSVHHGASCRAASAAAAAAAAGRPAPLGMAAPPVAVRVRACVCA